VVVTADEGTKILVAARKAQVEIRFGCASCRCGTCAVKVLDGSSLSLPRAEEIALLDRMALPLDGSVRLACQARLLGADVEVDLAFQLQYDPDVGFGEELQDEDEEDEDVDEDAKKQ
jgi:ferredoxin